MGLVRGSSRAGKAAPSEAAAKSFGSHFWKLRERERVRAQRPEGKEQVPEQGSEAEAVRLRSKGPAKHQVIGPVQRGQD